MDNTETKTGTEQKPGIAKVILVIIGIAAFALIAWRYYEQRKIDAVMKKVRQAKAEKNAIDNVGEAE